MVQMGWVTTTPITGSGERVRHLLFLSLGEKPTNEVNMNAD